MKKACLFILILFIAASVSFYAAADTVKLKKGGNLAGVIKQEDETSITLQIGMGTMKIQRSEIESIRKAGEKENGVLEASFRRTAIERGSFVPPGLEGMDQKLKAIPGKNVDAAKRQLDSLVQKLDANSDKINSLKDEFDKKNKEILGTDSKVDLQRYNSLVAENNLASAKISELWGERHKMGPKLLEYQAAYGKAITNYGNGIGDFGLYLDKTAEALKKRGMSDDESLYLESVRKSLADLQKSLNADTVAISKGAHGITVKAVLNDKVECLLVIDTGATVLVITKSIADNLGIGPNDLHEGKFSLADGSIIKSKITKIKSVRVGDSTVYNVTAGVTDNPPEPGVDGLLGMSFLKNFKFNLDADNGVLILEMIK